MRNKLFYSKLVIINKNRVNSLLYGLKILRIVLVNRKY
jgi:hypothetical protein